MDGKTPGEQGDQERREGGYVLQAQLLSMTGHDRDCALAMLSQAEHGRPLDNIQVVHLLSIGHRAGYRTGREDAAREFLESVIGYRFRGRHGDDDVVLDPADLTVMRAASTGGDDWCPCPDVDVSTFLDGPVTRTVRGRPDPSCPVHGNEINLGRSSRGVGDNTEDQQQGNG